MSADCEVIQISPEREQEHVRHTGNDAIKRDSVVSSILIFLWLCKMSDAHITCLMREAYVNGGLTSVLK